MHVDRDEGAAKWSYVELTLSLLKLESQIRQNICNKKYNPSMGRMSVSFLLLSHSSITCLLRLAHSEQVIIDPVHTFGIFLLD